MNSIYRKEKRRYKNSVGVGGGLRKTSKWSQYHQAMYGGGNVGELPGIDGKRERERSTHTA